MLVRAVPVPVPLLAAGTHEPRVDAPRTRRGRVSRVGASSGPTRTGLGTLRGPACGGPASSRQTCTGPVHMGALLAGSRELGPDECHHWLDHVRNCETCTGPFVKTLIAQLIYLMLCGIRLISHGTRLTRVCIFRYTWASSCHGWNSYGTRRPRVCGIPCVTSSRVPAGGMPGTLLPPVYGAPANWGQACTAGAPPGTREGRVCGPPANSRSMCTGALLARTRRNPVCRGPASSQPTCTGAPQVPAVACRSPSHPHPHAKREADQSRPPQTRLCACVAACRQRGAPLSC